MQQAFDTALHIEAWIVDKLQPGMICEELYAGALAMVESAGLAGHFMGTSGAQAKFVGHGVGLELDELPLLAPRFKQSLVQGNVIAVEPKFSYPGMGVVGIENTYAMTAEGCEKITDLANGIVSL
ncbi:MAG: hypothetical protein BWK76_06590 [Desulfobulbaceae bacterium A2]|nr:MAG: hypothetical protein BWK76_06590 [Desulfobulbaceae bacterium A2]